MISNELITQYALNRLGVETTKMFQIPQRILENLRCSICEGYLSSKPLMVKCENQQVCGKCYRILPAEEKSKCVRQIGLETLSEILIFPCRYNTQGCAHTFSWCDDKDHEVECPYRKTKDVFASDRSRQQTTNTHQRNATLSKSNILCTSDQVEAILRCEMKESKYSNELKILSYSLKVRGNCDNYLSVNSFGKSGIDDVEIDMRGSISIGNKPEILFLESKVVPVIRDNSYESLIKRPSGSQSCSKCGAILNGSVESHCQFGHSSCVNCKETMCMKCVRILETQSKKLCRNFSRGCEEPIHLDNIHNHQTNCRYNDMKCPVPSCNVIDTHPNIRVHLTQNHPHNTFENAEFVDKFQNKDKTIIILCYGGVFRCMYYYYKSFVEFCVTYLGPGDGSDNYSVEITVLSNGNRGRSKCSNWNNMMLEKGITFNKNDVVCDNDRKLGFDCKIKILSKVNV